MLMMYKILSEDMGQIKWCFQKKWGKIMKIQNVIFLKESGHLYHSPPQSTTNLLPNCLPILKPT